MKSQLIALAAAALLASVSGASLAQDANPPAPTTQGSSGGGGGGASAVRDACMADVMKACPDVHDRDSFRACLTNHYSDMSDGCKSAVNAMRSSMQSSGAGH